MTTTLILNLPVLFYPAVSLGKNITHYLVITR